MNIRLFLERLLFPVECPLCGEIVPVTKHNCSCSGDELTVISDDFCRHCGAEADNCRCTEKNGIPLINVAGVYTYSGKIRSQIALFKFRGEKSFAKEFSLRMSERVARVFSDVDFDAVAFVPASDKTKKERGYNQSELLAKGVAEKLFVPFEELLIKVKETDFQHNLPAAERVKNLDGAFAVKESADIKGRTILLCDDIKTTGTTLSKCAEALCENGAKEVYCIVLAVTDYLIDF